MAHPPIPGDFEDFVARLQSGERAIVARAATEFERGSELARDIIRRVEPSLGRAFVVGVTGPPGAGKSTLVNALLRRAARGPARIAVIAVDPSSQISGGAILGDRIRMTAALEFETVFVRSLSSGAATGGLSPAAVRMIDAFDAAGFDTVLLETVGTGQAETDVIEIADVRVVITAPGLGDGIQAMKAGLLEMADVIVVNKSDLPGAHVAVQELRSAVSLRSGTRAVIPVLKTSATGGDGVEALWDSVETIAAQHLAEGRLARRRRRARYLLAQAAAALIRRRIREGDATALDELADAVLSGALAPDEAAASLLVI